MNSNISLIPDRWVTPIRIATVLIVGLQFTLLAFAVGPFHAQFLEVCEPGHCVILQATQTDLAALEALGLNLAIYAAYLIAVPIVGALISLLLIGLMFWRASHTWVGITAILVISFFATMFSNVVPAVSLRGPEWDIWVGIAQTLSIGAQPLLFFFFPDGRFYPKWTRIPALLLTVAVILSALISGLLSGFAYVVAPEASIQGPTEGPFIVLAIIFQIITQIIRYRRYYTPQQKQQTRWVIASVAVQIIGIAIWASVIETSWIPSGTARIISTFFGYSLSLLAFALLPAALTISILRYRLWNIDLIIRRTLQYATITLVLALTYFGGVVLLQTIFNRVTGGDSPLAIVASTLLIAALFNPLRRRVQEFIDRRFYRQKYDTQQTLEHFGDIARDEVVLENIEQALVSTISDTMQPEHVSLWLRPGEKR